MRNKLMFGLLSLILVAMTIPAIAEVDVFNDGVRKGTAISVDFKNGPTVTKDGSVQEVNFATHTGDLTVTGDITVGDDLVITDRITDQALYSRSAGSIPVHLVKVGADGAVYGSKTESALYDSGIYGASAGVGAAKQMWVSADGKIYAP